MGICTVGRHAISLERVFRGTVVMLRNFLVEVIGDSEVRNVFSSGFFVGDFGDRRAAS